MEENGCYGSYGRADVDALWEHILTFDESIPANRAAMAEARERLKREGANFAG
jgi:hypothetical protein